MPGFLLGFVGQGASQCGNALLLLPAPLPSLVGWWWSVMAGSPGNSFFSDSEENFKRRKPGNVCVWWEALVTAPNPPPQSAFPSLTLLSFPLQPLWSGRTGHLLTPLLNPSPEPSTHLCYRGPLSWFLPSPHYLSSLILISLCPPSSCLSGFHEYNWVTSTQIKKQGVLSTPEFPHHALSWSPFPRECYISDLQLY